MIGEGEFDRQRFLAHWRILAPLFGVFAGIILLAEDWWTVRAIYPVPRGYEFLEVRPFHADTFEGLPLAAAWETTLVGSLVLLGIAGFLWTSYRLWTTRETPGEPSGTMGVSVASVVSMLLAMVLGAILFPAEGLGLAGEVTLDGTDLTAFTSTELAHQAMMFLGFALMPWWTTDPRAGVSEHEVAARGGRARPPWKPTLAAGLFSSERAVKVTRILAPLVAAGACIPWMLERWWIVTVGTGASATTGGVGPFRSDTLFGKPLAQAWEVNLVGGLLVVGALGLLVAAVLAGVRARRPLEPMPGVLRLAGVSTLLVFFAIGVAAFTFPGAGMDWYQEPIRQQSTDLKASLNPAAVTPGLVFFAGAFFLDVLGASRDDLAGG